MARRRAALSRERLRRGQVQGAAKSSDGWMALCLWGVLWVLASAALASIAATGWQQRQAGALGVGFRQRWAA